MAHLQLLEVKFIAQLLHDLREVQRQHRQFTVLMFFEFIWYCECDLAVFDNKFRLFTFGESNMNILYSGGSFRGFQLSFELRQLIFQQTCVDQANHLNENALLADWLHLILNQFLEHLRVVVQLESLQPLRYKLGVPFCNWVDEVLARRNFFEFFLLQEAPMNFDFNDLLDHLVPDTHVEWNFIITSVVEMAS